MSGERDSILVLQGKVDELTKAVNKNTNKISTDTEKLILKLNDIARNAEEMRDDKVTDAHILAHSLGEIRRLAVEVGQGDYSKVSV